MESLPQDVRYSLRMLCKSPGFAAAHTMFLASVLDARLSDQDKSSRAVAALTGFYAFLALVLAALGLFGALARSVGQRTQEIGIRMAFGALPKNVLRMVMGEGLL